MVTIAAVNGHAFAGGAIFACAFDYRFMQSDRGWFCFPEIDLKASFEPFSNALCKKAIPLYKLIDMQFTGRRMTAKECLEHHIVIKACPADNQLGEIIELAKNNNKDRRTIKILKQGLYQDIVQLLND